MDADNCYKALIQVDNSGENFQLRYLPRDTSPGPGRVLVKVLATTCNPSDRYSCTGFFGNVKTPCGIGIEGVGSVEETGEGVDTNLIGQLCGIYANSSDPSYTGTWGQYAVIDAKSGLMPFNVTTEKCDPNLLAAPWVNPMTVMLMMDIVEVNKHRAVIHSAAASSLGRMLIRMCRFKDVPLINIVRKEEHIAMLKQEEGAEYVLNSNSVQFREKLTELARSLRTTVFFDAVGGALTPAVLFNMPRNSTAYIYGMLSHELTTLNMADLMTQAKSIKGFILRNYFTQYERPREELFPQWLSFISKDLIENKGKIFGTKFTKSFALKDWKEIFEYNKKFGSQGKALIRPWQ